jgi:hypothetical protein
MVTKETLSAVRVYLLIFGVAFASGAAYQYVLNAKRAAREADTPRAILGLVIDGHWMGAYVTSQDYKLHCIQGDQLPLKSAAEIGQSLPEQSAMISNMSTPCGKQQDTKHDDGV